MKQSDEQSTIMDEPNLSMSEVNTVVLTYNTRNEALVTPDSGHTTFVKTHRAPMRTSAYVILIAVGMMLLGASLFGIGTIFGMSIAR